MTTSSPRRGRPPKGQERGYIERNGYRLRRCPDRKRYVYEHRLVMEAELGRRLDASELVHHLNGDKQDNRPENLRVTTRSEHAREHIAEGTWALGKTGPRYDLRVAPKPCAWCGKPFKSSARRVKCCSHSCGQKLRYAA